MDIPKLIAPCLSRPPAVFGAGVSGLAAAKLLERAGAAPVIYDAKGTAGAQTGFDATTAAKHDLVIYSPGFPHKHPWLAAARKAGALCLGETDFAFLFWKGPLVAITGTNGKTTLTEFLVFAHKRNGREAVAAGNIGFPLSGVLELGGSRAALPVCEVSSFQAEDMRYFAPTAFLWTNFDEDHLDRHANLETYFRAKYKLVGCLSTHRFIVGESVAAAARSFGIELPGYTEIATRAEVAGKIPADSPFATFTQRENYALARRYWLAEGWPEHALEEAARVFKPARHRLAKVAEIKEVSYWNDSKGTNFHAVRAAFDSLTGTPVHWIGGGQSKGGDLQAFAAFLAARAASINLIGQTSIELQNILQEKNIPNRVFTKLPDAVRSAATAARSGDAVLFSPGFSSFDMFKSYAERGILFEQTVNVLKKKSGDAK